MPQPSHILPKTPLCELYPNTRSRVVSAHDYRIQYRDITEKENLSHSIHHSIVKGTSNQVLYKSRLYTGHPTIITPRNERVLFRTIAINPMIITIKLYAEVLSIVLKIMIY